MPDAKPVNIFIAYAHADENFLRPLRKHLAVLEDDGVSIWYDGEILPGEEWDASIKNRLKAADIILLLVSIDFLTSDYVKGTELPTALSRHAAGECTVVPVIVRNCLWQKKLGALQALPKEARPVADWSSADNAYHNVVEGLDRVIEEIKKQRAATEQAKTQRDADISLQDDKKNVAPKNDPFADLMVFVKGGAFDMGSNKYETEKPIHRVTVPDFRICKYPVTQGQWKQIMGNNPAHFKGDDNRPVEQVSWNDAQAFFETLNRVTNKRYRLPSEAEWEYAARGGSHSKGFKYAGSNNIDEVAWYSGNSGDTLHPVGQKKPNELGLFDMSGNVWEWCEDVWHEDYKGAPEDGSAWLSGSNAYRVLRGGSWGSDGDSCRSADRDGNIPTDGLILFGFRLAQDK
jgi:formylglycine-generating enzyme required for sulfatase activity